MSDLKWWETAVIYQIYPRSFQDSNGDGVGDLPGITSRLEYISNLCVDAIWISPFFESPQKDFGYDVSDYCNINPEYGTLKDFDVLIAKAHSLGLRLMIDIVPAHCSEAHSWFQESRKSRNNPKSDWFHWVDPLPDGSAPTNWLSFFGGQAWSWEPLRQQYYLHNFLPSQPNLNHANHEVCDSIQGFIEKFRKVADSYEGDRFLMGELHGDDPVSASKSFTATGRLHATYNFNLLEWAGLSVEGIRSAIASAIDAFNGTGRLAFAFSNHDVPRSATRQLDALGLKQDQQEALQLLLLKLEVCLIGSTCIFQGEELACADVQDIPLDLMQDPWGKEFSPVFLGRDTCRTPMVWSKESNSWGDFSTADKTWLPISKEHLERAGIDEMNRPESVYNQFSSFLKWRKTQPAIMAANTMELINSRDHQIIFDRISNNQSLRCCFDFNTLTTSFSEN